jgi:hypothetical protein
VLAGVALLAVYGHFPQLHSIGGFTILLIAYVILLAGTLLRGVWVARTRCWWTHWISKPCSARRRTKLIINAYRPQ